MISPQSIPKALRLCHHHQLPNLSKSALLIIDLQEVFRVMATCILPKVQSLQHYFRDHQLPIIYTQHGNTWDEEGMMATWWGSLVETGTPQAELMPEILPQRGELVLPKKQYSAFYETPLDQHLKALGVTDLIISGAMTNCCCETTARDAFMRDYRVFFLVDGTATRSLELHMSTLRNLGFAFAYLVSCDTVMQNFS